MNAVQGVNTVKVSVLVFVACAGVAATSASGSAADDAERTAQASNPTSKSGTGRAAQSGAASRLDQAVRAVRTAESRVRGARAYDIEPDRLRGRPVWEVKVAPGVTRPYELDVRADGRRVMRQQRRARIDDDVRKLAGARVTLAQAMRIAARRASGATFDEAEIDLLRNKIVWDVEFERSGGREVQIKVDARTGRVLEVDVDD